MSTAFYNWAYKALVVIRVFAPITIFWWPVWSTAGNFWLDLIDGGAACRGVMKADQYQRIDKILDWWWFVFVLVFVYMHMNQYFLVMFALFVYRTMGEILFLKTAKRYWMLVFPNFFEFTFFVLIFGFKLNTGTDIFIVGFCVAREYLIHVANFSARKLLGMPVDWVSANKT